MPVIAIYLVGMERFELSILAALVSKTNVYTIPPHTEYLVLRERFELSIQKASGLKPDVYTIPPPQHIVWRKVTESNRHQATNPMGWFSRPVVHHCTLPSNVSEGMVNPPELTR